MLRWLPHDSALHRSQDPDGWMWGLQEQLTAALVDDTRGGNWQRGGGKGHRPKLVPRPGVGPKSETFCGKPVPLDEMKRRFEARRAEWTAEEDVS